MSAPGEPTARQKRVLDFIEDFTESNGYPPTVREIAKTLGFASTNAVAGHLKALRNKGLLDRAPGKSRGLRVPAGSRRSVRLIPVLGRIAAGRPIHAEENIEGHVAADPFLVHRGDESFVLRVEGDSMTGDGIMPGDYIFVRRQSVAEKGEIVVAMIGDEATVKRYVPMGEGVVRLEASNPAYPPIEVTPDDGESLEVLGVMTGLYRRV